MGLLSRYLAGPDPFDDRWYTSGSVVWMGDTLLAGPDSALRDSTVWRGVNVLAAGVAVLPIDVHREVGEGKGKEPLRKDPWRARLRRKPNRLQTSYRWRHHMMGHVVLGGNYYALNLGDQLYPLDPSRMSVAEVRGDGSVLYKYTTRTGEPKLYSQDDVFHLRGFSKDGIVGVSVLDLMRESVQTSLISGQHRRNFLKNELRPSVVITHPGDLGDSGKANVASGYSRSLSGQGVGSAVVLDEGMTIEAFQVNPKDAQWVEGDARLVEIFLRYIGVPGVLAGHPDKTATYASAEQFFQSFVTHGLFPWTRNIEQELTAFLYGDDEDVTIEMDLNGMMRPTAEARAQFYRALVEMGILTRNEVRELENRNPLPGLDDPLTPKNMGTGAEEAPAPARPGRRPPASEEEEREEEESRAHARAFRAAVARVLRKEALVIAGGNGKKGLAERYASDAAGWRRAVREFFEDHALVVAETLELPAAAAARYCEERRDEVLARGLAVVGNDGGRLERAALEAE